MILSLANIHENLEFSNGGEQAPREKLPGGNYPFQIAAFRKTTVPSKFGGDDPAVELDLLLCGSVKAPRIRIYLNGTKKNQANLRAFLRSIGMINADGTSKGKTWEELIGKCGKAHFVPKTLSHGGTVYEPMEWLPYDESKTPDPDED